MAEAKLDLSGNGGILQGEIDKTNKKIAEMREQIRTMNAEAKSGAKESQSAFTGMTRELTGMAARFVSAGAVVGAINAGYQAWRVNTDELIVAHRTLGQQITKTLAEAGKLNLTPQITNWAKGVKGIPFSSAVTTLGGVQQSGETLSDARAQSVAGELAKLNPTGADMQKLTTHRPRDRHPGPFCWNRERLSRNENPRRERVRNPAGQHFQHGPPNPNPRRPMRVRSGW